MPTIRERLFGKKISIFVDKTTGRPKTIISTGKSKGGLGGGGSQRTEAQLKQFWNYYESEGTIFASINTTAWNSVMVGFVLVSSDEQAKILIHDSLELMDIDSILLDTVIYGLVFGDAFIEKVKSGKSVVRLKTVDPTTMQINIDEYGEIISYQQKIQGKLLAPLKPEDIIHMRFFPKPDSPYGVSLISPSKDTIDRKITTDESIAKAIGRHGTPKYVIKVGSPEDIPPDEVFEDIKSKLEDIDSTNEFIIPGMVDISQIDETGVQSVKEYFDYFQTQLIVGLLCPEEALGQGKGSTEATARVKEIMYERFIKAIQHKITTLVRLEVINPILESNGKDPNLVYMRFNSVTDADEAIKAKWLGNLLRGFPEGQLPFTIDEIRAVFDYPPMSSSVPKGSEPKVPPKGQQKPGQPESAPEEKPEETEEQPQKPKEQSKIWEVKKLVYDLQDELEIMREELDAAKNKS
jgi:hypothetical protein